MLSGMTSLSIEFIHLQANIYNWHCEQYLLKDWKFIINIKKHMLKN